MPIESVRKHSSSVTVYDGKGRTFYTKSRGSLSGHGIKGYAVSTVSIRTRTSINTYDDRGRTPVSKHA
jgi:hypothetical protein